MLFQAILLWSILLGIQISQALYIKSSNKIGNLGLRDINNEHDDEWTMFKHKLGLTNEKVALLKSQEDQTRIKELLREYMAKQSKTPLNHVGVDYKNLLNVLKLSKRIGKTFLKIKLADRKSSSNKNKKEQLKISLTLTAAMPTKEIIDMLRIL